MSNKRDYKYVSCFDGVWRLTKRNYRRFLERAASGKMWDLNDFGVQVVPNIDLNASDMNWQEAQYLLQELPARD